MPREQVMCAAVSGGSAAADDAGPAGASLNVTGPSSLESAVVVANVRAALAVWHGLEARSTGAFAFVDSNHATPALCCAGNIGKQSTINRRKDRAISRKCYRIAAPLGFVLLQQATGMDVCGFV
jgi:hypothetical protein